MNKNTSSNKLLIFFSSIKLTIFLLLSLAATSVIGTVIEQNLSSFEYIKRYGQAVYNIFKMLNITDMYHSWWFLLLISLLVLNIIICSIQSLKKTWSSIFVKNPKFNINQFKKYKNRVELLSDLPLENLAKRADEKIIKKFSYKKTEKTEKGTVFFAEKNRWTKSGVYVVHLGVILLLAGSLAGSIAGFDGYMNLPEGEKSNIVKIRSTNKSRQLDFSVQCDDFNVLFYDSGMAKEYKSALSVIENNKIVLKKNIVVNTPLRYKGINFFQSSYGVLDPEKIHTEIYNKQAEKIYKFDTDLGKSIKLPDNMGTFTIKNYHKSFNFKGRHIGEAFTGVLKTSSNDIFDIVMPYPFFEIKPAARADFSSMINMLCSKRSRAYTKNIPVTFLSAKTGMIYKKTAEFGQNINIPEDTGSFTLIKIEKNYSYRGHNLGETYIGKLTNASGNTEEIVIPRKYPEFDKMRTGRVVIKIEDKIAGNQESEFLPVISNFHSKYYTGLQVNRDPGVYMVYLGFIFILSGCFIAFFITHERICILLEKTKKQTKIMISGKSDKNAPGMERKISQFLKIINKKG